MEKIQNISGVDRTVPELGGRLVLDRQVVEVPADRVDAYLCQTEIWARPSTKKGDD